MNLNCTCPDLAKEHRDAQLALIRLLAKGPRRPDREIARDPDYRQLHRAGMRIALAGGEAAIDEAIRDLCANAPIEGAEAELKRFWAAMGRWH